MGTGGWRKSTNEMPSELLENSRLEEDKKVRRIKSRLKVAGQKMHSDEENHPAGKRANNKSLEMLRTKNKQKTG